MLYYIYEVNEMKKETEELLNFISTCCIKDDKRVKQFKDFIAQVKKTEVALTQGGYMQDSNGTLIKSGDFITFQVDNHAPECDRGVAYAQLAFSQGRFHLINGNPLMNINPAGIYDMADLYDAGFKFFKVDEGFDEEGVYVKVNGEFKLLKPEVCTDKADGSKYLEFYDADNNRYDCKRDSRLKWGGSHF
jgi:hypothetical protein